MADELNLGPSLADLDKEETLTPVQQQAKLFAEQQAADKAAQEKAEADKKTQEDAAKVYADEIAKLVASGKTEDEAKATVKARESETPEQKIIREKAEVVEATKIAEAEDQGSKDAVEFYQRVDKLHGFEDFKFEAPEGTEPGTEEYTHMREAALIDHTRKDFEGLLKQSDPRGYSYLLHRQQGGSDEDFFAKPSITLPEYEVFKNDVDLHKQIVVRDLKIKGVDEDLITSYIDKAIREKKLFEKADVIYKAADTAEKKALAEAEKAVADRTTAEKKAVENVINTISDIVTNNKTEKIQIPDTKKAAFNEYLKQNLFFDGENFFFMEPLSKDNLNQSIEYRYFAFVKGNLSDLVQRRAATQVTKGFKLGAQKAAPIVKGAQTEDLLKDNVPVSQL